MLDQLENAGLDTLAVGKINDIFASKGVTDTVRTHDNVEGIEKLIERTGRDFEGICFVNLVDFDMIYGHRNDVDGYAKALTYFDEQLPKILKGLRPDDILMITADHGCDPSTPSTDHSREYIPLVIYGEKIVKGVNIGTRKTFADIAATILEYFDVESRIAGTSFLKEIVK
jgi:phosphopentomutase